MAAIFDPTVNEADVSAEKNADAFAELIQCLDDRSLGLIMRDAKDNGRNGIKMLREHYLGKSKPRIIGLYNNLCTLCMKTEESGTDYLLRAEKSSNMLKAAGEDVSDGLLIAMIIKGLPSTYSTFSVLTSQKENPSFAEFEAAFRAFEETIKISSAHGKEDQVMMTPQTSRDQQKKKDIKCYACGKLGHKSFECRSKNSISKKNRWCTNCNSNTHDSAYCRKTNHSRSAKDNVAANEESLHVFNVTGELETGVKPEKVSFLVDSGATSHIVHDQSIFIEMYNFDATKHILELADGTRCTEVVKGKGKVSFHLNDTKGVRHEIILENTLYVPSYSQNIFSVKAGVCRGLEVNFAQDRCLLSIAGSTFEIYERGRLYYLNSVNSEPSRKSVMHWHKVMGHCNSRDLLKLKNVTEGMTLTDGQTELNCGICIEGKMTQERSRKPDGRAEKLFDLVHCDLAGPIDPMAKDGFRYAMLFVDDYTGIHTVYFLKHKDDAVTATEKFIAEIAPYGTVKCIRSDNGGEFVNSKFEALLRANKVKHETSAPYSPHQNGTVERAWRTIFEMARCQLLESKLPKQLWTYAVMCSVHIKNRSYNHRTGKTPYESVIGKRPDMSRLHIFGTECFAYVQQKKKLDARAEKGIFVGYDKGSPAFLVYCRDTQTVKRVRCVTFTDRFTSDLEVTGRSEHDDSEIEATLYRRPDSPEQDNASDQPSRRSNRESRRPKHLDDYVTKTTDRKADFDTDYCYRLTMNIPSTYSEAITSPESHQWQAAMESEIANFENNDVYELTELPNDRDSVKGRWVYAVKENPNQNLKYKARYVAKGFSQKAGVDYDETFAPTAKMTTIRTLMNVVAQDDMVIHQLDVKAAYLNAPIDHEIYLEQAQGFEVKSASKNLVWKLKKSVYGLKQSGRNWNETLDDYLKERGFENSIVDPCLYTRTKKDSTVLMLVWVDDILIAGSDKETVDVVKTEMKAKFDITDFGRLSYFLGIQFNFAQSEVRMNQAVYVEKVLSKFGMTDCRPRLTPCDQNLQFTNDDRAIIDVTLYREMIGSFIYLMTCTRPDICWIVTKLSQFLAKPTSEHHAYAKQVLRYLKGTMKHELVFRKSSESLSISGHADSDWAGSEDRKSISGYCFKLNENSGVVSWRSKKQDTVALSSCEAEYMSLTLALQEGLFLMQLMSDMRPEGNFESFSLKGDNQGALALSKNPVHHKRSKHIDVKFHFIRENVKSGKVVLTYVQSSENNADVFTKSVGKILFERCVSKLFG
ncbi:MAG: reverse transcriptase domain-containing protein [Kangiellaceae bacterium]|nr:reverse transcriptase domain-containing protein [Kangiellaceae bacterium]